MISVVRQGATTDKARRLNQHRGCSLAPRGSSPAAFRCSMLIQHLALSVIFPQFCFRKGRAHSQRTGTRDLM